MLVIDYIVSDVHLIHEQYHTFFPFWTVFEIGYFTELVIDGDRESWFGFCVVRVISQCPLTG